MWFGIEGNPRWLLEMLSLVNRKTNGSAKKKAPMTNLQHPEKHQPPAFKIQHPEKLQASGRSYPSLLCQFVVSFCDLPGCWLLKFGASLDVECRRLELSSCHCLETKRMLGHGLAPTANHFDGRTDQ